jgi:OmcA/MtrC family decaheme c-type cytochrome
MNVQRRSFAPFIALGILLTITGCSDDDDAKGSSCSVARDDASGAATITCDDGTSVVIEAPGPDAGSCSVVTSGDGKKKLECSDGTSLDLSTAERGAQGERGPSGDPGTQGEPGGSGEPGTQGDPGDPGRSASVAGEGLRLEVMTVEIPEDLHPVATLTIKDAAARPLDRTGVYTPGTISANFMLARLTSGEDGIGEYAPYNIATVTGAMVGGDPPALANAMQPRAENNGTWTELDAAAGSYRYRFNQALPADYDKSKTHTLAIYASRAYEGVTYASNPLHHFRPDGQAVTEKREIVSTAACNNCHGTLAEHGGSRREIGLCITCHVDGMKDPESGNSIDMAQMIHHIHRGSSLPSVVAGTPYRIIGFQGAVHDYSQTVFPQAIENCETCHQGGADSDRWKTALTRRACGACHDRISFMSPAPAGFTLHSGGQQTTDTLCANCHAEGTGPIATLETDVVKVHRTLTEFPLRNAQTGAVTAEPPQLTGTVVGLTGTAPGGTPVVRFTVAVNGAPYDILAGGQALNRLRFTFAGPTTDYAGYIQYTAQGSGAVGTLAAGSTAGEFTWTPPGGVTMTTIATACETLPAGSFAVGMEGRMTASATRPDATVATVNYPMHNAVAYFAVTGSEPVPRREAVVVEKCNNCHQDLEAHGGSRNDPEYCVLCHNANKDTTNIPLPAVGSTKLTTSVRLSNMIHRIHTGDNGTKPYVIGSDDFSELLFPGDRRDCTMCHVESHYELPLTGLLPTRLTQIDSTRARVTMSDYFIEGTAAACTGCHDSDETFAHTEATTTASGVESCAVCHGAGATFDVDVVHARPGL